MLLLLLLLFVVITLTFHFCRSLVLGDCYQEGYTLLLFLLLLLLLSLCSYIIASLLRFSLVIVKFRFVVLFILVNLHNHCCHTTITNSVYLPTFLLGELELGNQTFDSPFSFLFTLSEIRSGCLVTSKSGSVSSMPSQSRSRIGGCIPITPDRFRGDGMTGSIWSK